MKLQAVEKFKNKEEWEYLDDPKIDVLLRDVAGLPSELEADELDTKLFDLLILKMQLALVQGDQGTFENKRGRVIEISELLEEKANIPAVQEQIEFLELIREQEFWEGIEISGLEEIRLKLRGLVVFLDKKHRKIVYTDFKDEVLGVKRGEPIEIPKMTGTQFEKKFMNT